MPDWTVDSKIKLRSISVNLETTPPTASISYDVIGPSAGAGGDPRWAEGSGP